MPRPPRPPNPPPQCDCPKEGGVICHRRATCTDPIVAKLNWYADETEALFAPEHAHELNPPPSSGPVLDMLCRGGNHEGCIGPPGTRCDCRCHPEWKP